MVAYIEGKTGKWEYVIGLEVHAQIISKSKLFSSSPVRFGEEPNYLVNFVDAAMPGMLPVLNEFCVEQAVKSSLGINARVNQHSTFDRKNYFYPDLPQGYQISQFFHPIAENGWLEIINEDNVLRKINIERLHIEQDAGKSIHDASEHSSFIDLNRCGVGLMEIVSAPELRSAYEAAEYVKKLRNILRYLNTCDGDMEKGSLRCDANVSVRKPGDILGIRCEIKNLNSTKNIMQAIEYEAARHVELLENGGVVSQETRIFDASTGKTRSMRSKEDAMEYRYFPDPDLLPLNLSEQYIENIRASLPELPDAKSERYKEQYSLSKEDVAILVNDKIVADYFEKVAGLSLAPKLSANWIIVELFAYLKKFNCELQDCKIKPESLAELVILIQEGVISGKMAKGIFDEMFETGSNPKDIVKSKNLQQISDDSSIINMIKEVLDENADSVNAYNSGKTKLLAFFVGQIMKKTSGKADPVLVNKLLVEELAKHKPNGD
ncbi:MAG: Asp-tRNA(Asn)/Glu-tRNA(Gln) amidotransferase subunit GatB [Rickettsiaceae bacterium]|nr:Asp-tRNA(Asn)/Glu-tRNA(Gln) amidotransferase subunit GatB [Rickettsiaceae bacterium]